MKVEKYLKMILDDAEVDYAMRIIQQDLASQAAEIARLRERLAEKDATIADLEEQLEAMRRLWRTFRAHHGHRVTLNSLTNETETVRELMNNMSEDMNNATKR